MKLLSQRRNSLKIVFCLIFSYTALLGYSQLEEVSVADLQMSCYEKDSSAGAVILFDIGKTDLDMIYGEFVMKFTRHVRIKLFNEKELEWADVIIPYYYENVGEKETIKIKKAVTYNLVNGEIEKTALGKKSYIEETTTDFYKQIKFAFANVKPGSIIEYEYELLSPFKQPKTWYFQYSIPVIYSEYKAELASFWQYKTLLKGYEIPVIDTSFAELGAGTCHFTDRHKKSIEYNYHKANYQIAFKNVPAFYYEDNMQCTEDYISKVDFQLTKYEVPEFVEESILKTWEEVAEEYCDLYDLDEKIKMSDELEKNLSDQTLKVEEKTKIIL